ncbi:DMP19 family protein [Arthrobacter sp. RAF14]|uniref:DMP19 family protein n=1 Tax=Arthrobacter sp. RAF14 TaxID=3233051 RepID=UPI003F91B19D
MTDKQLPVVLFKESLEAGPDEVVDGNVTVVNAMYQELLGQAEIAEDALRSYYVDFYLTQALGGGFAQYVFTATDREEIDAYVRGGLEAMGATAHLALFDRTAAAFEALSEDEVDAYLDGDAEDEQTEVSDAVLAQEELDNEFETLLETEDLMELNAAWLRGLEGLLVVDEDGLDAVIDERLKTVDDLEERRAQAEAASLEDMPDFEIIIRELCDLAEVELEKITLGDPNFVYEAETVVAWHFLADGEEYIMVELDDEALMLRPESLEVVAAVEIEEIDDDELEPAGADA